MRTTKKRNTRIRTRVRSAFVAAPLSAPAVGQGHETRRTGENLVHPGTVYQAIQGWGGNIYPAAAKHAARDATLHDKAFQELRTTHMPVRSSWYLLEGQNDNDDSSAIDWEAIRKGDQGEVHDEFLWLREMSKRGVRLLFVAWRHPRWMCGEPADWRSQSGDRPPLPKGMETEFVESLTAYLVCARDQYGVLFAAILVSRSARAAL